MAPRSSRRAFLGLAGLAATAGCTWLPGLGDREDPCDWLYAPAALGDWRLYGFRYVEPATVADYRDRLPDADPADLLERHLIGRARSLDLDPGDVEWVLRGSDPLFGHPSVAVVHGDLDADRLRSAVEAIPSPAFRAAGVYRGFDRFESDRGAAGVDDGLLIWATGRASPVAVETAIRTSEGEIGRAQERTAAAAAMVERLFPATYVFVQMRADGDVRGEGFAQRVDGDRTEVLSTTVFASAEAVPDAATAAETWYAEAARERVDDVSVDVDGEAVVGTGSMPTDRVELGKWPFRPTG
jgi:hypothetical protein